MSYYATRTHTTQHNENTHKKSRRPIFQVDTVVGIWFSTRAAPPLRFAYTTGFHANALYERGEPGAGDHDHVGGMADSLGHEWTPWDPTEESKPALTHLDFGARRSELGQKLKVHRAMARVSLGTAIAPHNTVSFFTFRIATGRVGPASDEGLISQGNCSMHIDI